MTKRIPLFLIAALTLVACGTSPEFVEEPEVANKPAPAPAQGSESDENLPEVQAPPCGMATRAVLSQARRGRYRGVEGFDSRTCPPAGGPPR
jgi:hypothetical protein